MVDITRLNKSSFSAEESGQDALENTFTQKHKELSVLLLEMKEAQEEIAFLKLQLQGKRAEGDPEFLDQKEMKQIESEGILPVKMTVLLEDTGQHFPPTPDPLLFSPPSPATVSHSFLWDFLHHMSVFLST